MTGNDAWRRNEVVALLRLRKDKRNVVSLVTPRVHIHWCEENSERRVQHDSVLMQVVGDPYARSKIKFIGIAQSFRKSLLPANEHGRKIGRASCRERV